MSNSHSVTDLIEEIKIGNPIAAQSLWDRYMQSLIRIANKRLRSARVRLGDEEDAVVMAFNQFLERTHAGGFSKLDDRTDLWRILVMLTERRVYDMIRREKAQKNGGKELVGESYLDLFDSCEHPRRLEQIAGSELSPEFAATLVEEFENRIKSLEKAELKSIAISKMNGWTNQEISEKIGISLRSVERKLKIIRTIWSGEIASESR